MIDTQFLLRKKRGKSRKNKVAKTLWNNLSRGGVPDHLKYHLDLCNKLNTKKLIHNSLPQQHDLTQTMPTRPSEFTLDEDIATAIETTIMT
jgi:hypothetical protein